MNPIPDYSTKIRNVSAAGYDTWMEPREGYPGFWKPFKAL